MAETIHLEVITPHARVFAGDVETVVAPGFEGDFGVLPDHVAYITAVRAGVLTFEHAGKPHHYVVGAGFAEVSSDKVILLADVCEDAGSVDAATAADAMRQDEQVMLDKDPTAHEYLDAQADQALQIARLRAAEEAGGKGD